MIFSSKLRRVAAAILAAATATAMLVPLTAGSASAVPGFTFTRLAGADRFDTARRIAVATFGTADTVLLARADLFPDALSGSYLAGSTDGGSPILLTEVNRIPAATNEALATLGTDRVILLGGPAAISASVEGELRARNLQVERIGGRDRFETSQQIAERLGSGNVGTVNSERTAVVASGRNFPDALSGGPISFARRLPSILTDTNNLPSPARNALSNLGIRRVFLLGGPAAVSGNVQTQIEQLGIAVERFGGANRQETATLVAETAIDRLGFDDTHINLARGDFFSDALTGGPHAGDESDGGSAPGAPPAPIVLTVSPTILGAETSEFLRTHANTLRDGHIFGGQAAVTDAVESEAARAAGSGRSIVVVDQTSVEPGGTITGNVSGEGVNRVFVSGCGLNERELNRDSQGDFSLTIPSSQPTGSCALTFRVTFTDGSTETDTVTLTVTEPSRISTAAPELVSATFVRRFIQPSTGSGFSQTVVRFTFDEAVTGQALVPSGSTSPSCGESTPGCSSKFKLYRFDQSPSSDNTNRVFSGVSAQVDSADTKSVLVTFGRSDQPLTEIIFRELTVAAVSKDAVKDGSSISNPYGDVGLNAVLFEPGRTAAPDLVRVNNFRPNFDGTRTLVDFVFDEPAFSTSSATAFATQDPADFRLVLNDAEASERRCFFQPGDSTSNGEGTTIHTVSCEGTTALVQLTPGEVARGIIEPNSVGATRGSSPPNSVSERNPLQAADVTGEGATSRPDLVSAQFFDGRVNGTPEKFDQALFTFDEPVIVPAPTSTTADPDPRCPGAGPSAGTAPPSGSPRAISQGSCFRVYTADGKELFGNAEANQAPVRNPDNDRQVIVTFPDGSFAQATGASVAPGAVLEAIGTGGVNRTNRADEVEVQGVSFASGVTSAPDLVACQTEVTGRNPVTGAPTTFRVVLSFDEAVAASSPVAGNFAFYDANGSEFTLRGPSGGTATPTVRSAPANDEVVFEAAQEDIGRLASCGVAEGAVTEASQTSAKNPIGYEPLVRPST